MHWNTCTGNVAQCGYFQMLGKGSQGFKLYDASICAVLEGLIPWFLSDYTSQTGVPRVPGSLKILWILAIRYHFLEKYAQWQATAIGLLLIGDQPPHIPLRCFLRLQIDTGINPTSFHVITSLAAHVSLVSLHHRSTMIYIISVSFLAARYFPASLRRSSHDIPTYLLIFVDLRWTSCCGEFLRTARCAKSIKSMGSAYMKAKGIVFGLL